MTRSPIDAGIDRRTLLRWAGATSAAAAAPLALATGTAPTGHLRDYLRMRGALDDRLVVGALSGQYFGVIDGEILPMFGVLGVTFTRWRPLDDGRWLSASFEHACYTDKDSGEVLREWRNPLNGRSGPVPAWTSRPAALLLHPDLSRHHAKPLPHGFIAEDVVSSIDEYAGERVIVQRVRSAVPRPAPAKPYRYSELVTMRAELAALREGGAARVPCSMSFTNISGWRPWQQMGEDQAGHMMAHGAGHYGLEIESLPPIWLAETRRLKPDWFANPARHLDAVFLA